ncbi:MAG: glutaredoxin family protein, partial [Myxococcota bacterium]
GASATFALAIAGLGAYWVWHEPDPSERIVTPTLEIPEVPAVSAEPALRKAPAAAPPAATDPWASLREDSGTAPAASASAAEDDEERERKIEAAMKRVSVTVYYTPTCPSCQEALAWLKLKKIPHTARDVEASDSTRRKWKYLSASKSVPKFDIGGHVLEGFSEGAVMAGIREVAEKRVDQGRY